MPIEYRTLTEQEQLWQRELMMQISRETRLPLQRVMMLEWNQIDGKKIQMRSREAELQPLTAAAIGRLPCCGRFVFSTSPFPPIIPDEYLEGAKRWCRKQNRKIRGRLLSRA